MTQYTIADLAQVHQKIKAKRSALKAAFEREDAELEEAQRMLRAEMLKQINATGGNSVRTDFGTVYRTKKTKYSAADWGAIWTWMKENDAPDILERRLKSTFLNEFAENNNGEIPPGINSHSAFDVSVRAN